MHTRLVWQFNLHLHADGNVHICPLFRPYLPWYIIEWWTMMNAPIVLAGCANRHHPPITRLQMCDAMRAASHSPAIAGNAAIFQ